MSHQTFKEWFDTTYRDLDGGTTGIPESLADDLLLAWNAGHAAGSSTPAPQGMQPDLGGETLAAGAIIDIMSGGNLDWRARIDQSDFLESADWQTALAYARAARAAPPVRSAASTVEPVAARCPHCDDTGDVHRADGEWLGSCDCKADAAPTTSPEPDAVRELDNAAFQNTDDAPALNVLAAVRHCAASWDGAARLLGNVRASDIFRACNVAIAALARPEHGGCISVPAEPNAEILMLYGYAPGGYMTKCLACDEVKHDLDKLATSCKPCATARYKRFVEAASLARNHGESGGPRS